MAQELDFQKLPPLKTLKGFEAAARLLSLRKAADELHLTHAAISHQIRLLEDDLGVQLFSRNGRNIELTQMGEQFYPVARNVIETLINGSEAIRRSCNTSELTIQTYITVSIRWLSHRVPRFRALYPDLDLSIITKITNRKFDEANADVGLVYSQKAPPEHLHWIPLISPNLFPVCSPELLGDCQQPLQPEELMDYPLITISTEKWQWQDWLISAGLEGIIPEQSLVVDNTATALEMAKDGEGIALVNGPFADKDLEKGRLIQPVEHVLENHGEWGLICRKDMLDDERVAAFNGWLQDDVKQYS